MITISLDEQGDFEGLKEKKNEPVFIGGILYDDRDDEADFENEKKRIEQYLRAVCEQVGAVYPQDLHVGESRNGKKVREVKIRLGETLNEFFYRGTCPAGNGGAAERLNRMETRRGKYHIFAMVKSREGKRDLLKLAASDLIRDDFASNLYIHMAEDVVERVIFHNPLLDVKHMRLDLATRRVVLEKNEGDKAKEYEKLGYRTDEKHKEDGKLTYILTNPDNYRTAIEREMMDTGKSDIMVERVGVKSIYYGNRSSSGRMVFLYLADIICSKLGFGQTADSSDEMLREFKKRADFYSGHSDNLIFAYDSVDTKFRKAWERLEARDYFEALKTAYEASTGDSRCAAYYRDVWFRRMEERIKEETDVAAYEIALRKLFNLTRTSNLDQQELLYIFSHLEKLERNMKFKTGEQRAVLYELYDAGVSAYSHIGDSGRAFHYFEKCREHAKYIGTERYMRTRNKMTVFLCDWFRYEKALELAEENLLYQGELLTMKKLLFGDELEASLDYTIAQSQLGQVYSYLRDNRAEEAFLSALEGMAEKNAPNYLQTLSYLLHHYLDMGNQEAYDAAAAGYFGGNRSFSKQLRYLLAEGSKGENAKISLKFALYVYVKGVYLFHRDDISGELFEKLIDIEETLRKAGMNARNQLKGHPWELIYKYLAFICLAHGQVQTADACMEKAVSILQERGFALDMICWFSQLQYAWLKKDAEAVNRIFEYVPDSLKEETELWQTLNAFETDEQKYNYLSSRVIVYTFQ